MWHPAALCGTLLLLLLLLTRAAGSAAGLFPLATVEALLHGALTCLCQAPAERLRMGACMERWHSRALIAKVMPNSNIILDQ